jgi:hypothetical protein
MEKFNLIASNAHEYSMHGNSENAERGIRDF